MSRNRSDAVTRSRRRVSVITSRAFPSSMRSHEHPIARSRLCGDLDWEAMRPGYPPAGRACWCRLHSCCRFESLEEGVHGDAAGVLCGEVPEPLGDLAEGRHLVVKRVLLEEKSPRVHD